MESTGSWFMVVSLLTLMACIVLVPIQMVINKRTRRTIGVACLSIIGFVVGCSLSLTAPDGATSQPIFEYSTPSATQSVPDDIQSQSVVEYSPPPTATPRPTAMPTAAPMSTPSIVEPTVMPTPVILPTATPTPVPTPIPYTSHSAHYCSGIA